MSKANPLPDTILRLMVITALFLGSLPPTAHAAPPSDHTVPTPRQATAPPFAKPTPTAIAETPPQGYPLFLPVITRDANITTSLTPPPQAEFDAAPRSGPVPLTVTFSDHSTGSVLTRTWTFGDGRQLVTTNPTATHTYTQSHLYSIALTVSGPGGQDTVTKNDYIEAVDPNAPDLDFQATPIAGNLPHTVTFSLPLTPAASTRYTWDFGDGSHSDQMTPQHVYTRPGLFTVSLQLDTENDTWHKQKPNLIAVADPQTRTLAVITPDGGVLSNQTGTISLTIPPNAISETLILGLAGYPLYDPENEPGNGEPLAGIALHAWRPAQPLQALALRFERPVTLSYTLSATEAAALAPESLTFVYFNEASDPVAGDEIVEVAYEPLLSRFDPETLQLSAAIDHFSTYGVTGDQASWVTPGLDAFQVSLARGAATYSYDLPLPAGPNDFGPQLQLRYNSGIPNGLIGLDNSDTGWVGVGWMLELGHLTEGELALNGVYEEIFPEGNGRYHTEHQTYMRIERVDHNREVAGIIVQGDAHWVVTDRQGTVYYFGTDPASGAGATLSYYLPSSEGCKWRHRVYKLYKIVDRHGNTLTIDYKTIPGEQTCGPSNETARPIAEAYPTTIAYTTNPTAGDNHAEYLITFETQYKGFNTRGDSKYGDGNYKLTTIKSWYRPTPEATPQFIRAINFSYDTDPQTRTNLLRQLTIAADAGPAPARTLPPLTFDYTLKPVGRRWQALEYDQ